MTKTNLIETITLPPLKGKKLIKDATDIFAGYIDSDFKNWNTKTHVSKQMKVEVREMTEDATFEQMFSKETLLTQDQIIYFVENFKNLLRTDGYATFFPFKSGEEVFVADVDFYSDEQLEVGVFRLSDDNVWDARYRHRIVVPQLTLNPSESDPLSLAPFDTSDVKVKLRDFIESLEELYKSMK